MSCSVWFSAPSFWMGGGFESCRVGRVYGADGAVHHPHCTHDLRSGSQGHHPSRNSTTRTVHMNYAAALKTTTHPETQPSAPYTRTMRRLSRPPPIQKLNHPHRTHEL